MQGLLFNVTSLLFFAFLLLNIFSWISLWERKDHNYKRFFIFIKDTREGRSLIFGPLNLLKWFVLFSYILTVFISGVDVFFHYAVFLLYFVLVANFVRRAYQREFDIPTFSASTLIIFSLVGLIEFSLFMFAPLDKFLWMLILDKILTVLIFLSILFISIFFDFSSDVTINRAINKVLRHKNLLTIIVVGSYAKGSTKEFIARILKSKYNVLENKNSFDTPLGISKTIVAGLDPRKQIFIAEIEDYRQGDIAEMARIVRPNIAVITGINDRNISLFGSMDRILKSKAEAIEELSSDGVAIINAANENSLKLSVDTRKKKLFYSQKSDGTSEIYINSIAEGKLHTSFIFTAFGKKYSTGKLSILGRQNIESLLPGILIGLYMGIDYGKIKSSLEKLQPLPGSMSPRRLESGAVIIDDTYNINVNSVLQIVDYARLYRGKKYLILEPIEELGKNSKKDHEAIGERVGKEFDYVFLINSNNKKDIEQGILKSGRKCRISVMPPSTIAEFIEKNTEKDDMVALEGKKAGRVLAALSFQEV